MVSSSLSVSAAELTAAELSAAELSVAVEDEPQPASKLRLIAAVNVIANNFFMRFLLLFSFTALL
jgi:hypothetical protein